MLRRSCLEAREIVVDHLQVAPDGGAVAAVVGADQQVFLGVQVLEDVAAFQRLDDAQPADLLGVLLIDALAVPLDAAVGDLALLDVQQPGYRLKRGALAGAVGPEQGDDGAVLHGHRDAVQHPDDVEVGDLDVVQLEHCSII